MEQRLSQRLDTDFLPCFHAADATDTAAWNTATELERSLRAREIEYELRHQVGNSAPYSMLVRSKLDPTMLESLARRP